MSPQAKSRDTRGYHGVWQKALRSQTNLTVQLKTLTDVVQRQLWGRVTCLSGGGVTMVVFRVVVIIEFKEARRDTTIALDGWRRCGVR